MLRVLWALGCLIIPSLGHKFLWTRNISAAPGQRDCVPPHVHHFISRRLNGHPGRDAKQVLKVGALWQGRQLQSEETANRVQSRVIDVRG